MENSNIIEAGAVIRLNSGVDGVCGDYILARIKSNKYKLIGITNGNRLRDKSILENSLEGITLDELQTYLGPNYQFEILAPALETILTPSDGTVVEEEDVELTKAQFERLALIAEEAAEVVQIANKIIRFGYKSTNPKNNTTNRSLLETELGDLVYVMSLAVDRGDLSVEEIERHAEEKGKRIGPYLRYNTPL